MAILTESGLIHGVINVQFRYSTATSKGLPNFFAGEWFLSATGDMSSRISLDSPRRGSARATPSSIRLITGNVISGRLLRWSGDLVALSLRFCRTETFDLDAAENRGLFIPVGVAHGSGVNRRDAWARSRQPSMVRMSNGLVWNDPGSCGSRGGPESLPTPRAAPIQPLTLVPSSRHLPK